METDRERGGTLSQKTNKEGNRALWWRELPGCGYDTSGLVDLKGKKQRDREEKRKENHTGCAEATPPSIPSSFLPLLSSHPVLLSLLFPEATEQGCTDTKRGANRWRREELTPCPTCPHLRKGASILTTVWSVSQTQLAVSGVRWQKKKIACGSGRREEKLSKKYCFLPVEFGCRHLVYYGVRSLMYIVVVIWWC